MGPGRRVWFAQVEGGKGGFVAQGTEGPEVAVVKLLSGKSQIRRCAY